MLKIDVPTVEYFDPNRNEFVYIKGQTISLEHSLISISKWEAKWEKPFIGQKNFTDEELIDYVRCMSVNPNTDPSVFLGLTQEHINEVVKYIDSKMTATTFSNNKHDKGAKEVITSELIYYWMVAYNIPFECQKWHLNRLLTLVRICGIKNAPSKKMGKHETMSRNKSLNAARRAKNHSKG